MVSPSSREYSADSTSTLPYSYGQAVFPTSSPISLTTTTSLPAPSFQDSFKSLSSSFLHFPLHPVLDSSSIFLSKPPSYSDSLSFLFTHASMDRTSSSLSYTLSTSSLSSLSLPYPIYRPLPIYASPRAINSSMESIPYLYSSVLSTNTLSMSHHGGSSTMVSSVSSRLSLVVPGERLSGAVPETGLEAGPETTLSILPGDNVLDLLFPVVPCPAILSFFPYFPLGPTPLAIITQMIP